VQVRRVAAESALLDVRQLRRGSPAFVSRRWWWSAAAIPQDENYRRAVHVQPARQDAYFLKRRGYHGSDREVTVKNIFCFHAHFQVYIL